MYDIDEPERLLQGLRLVRSEDRDLGLRRWERVVVDPGILKSIPQIDGSER